MRGIHQWLVDSPHKRPIMRKELPCQFVNMVNKLCFHTVDTSSNTTIWWRHQMETFSALLALCEGNPLVTSGFPSQRLVTWSFDVFFDLRLNKRLSKQSWGWWFETPSHPLWRHSNDLSTLSLGYIDATLNMCNICLYNCPSWIRHYACLIELWIVNKNAHDIFVS